MSIIEALPKWLGNLTSLIYLEMRDCKNLMYLPTVEVMQRLTKLGTLVISGCPLLAERCAKESGPEWHKISHIPDIREGSYSIGRTSDAQKINAWKEKRVYWSDEATLKLSVNYLFVYVRSEESTSSGSSENFPKMKRCTEESRSCFIVYCNTKKKKKKKKIFNSSVSRRYMVSAIYMASQLLKAESRLKKKLMHAIFGASIHLKCRQSLEVVFNNLMNWRIYSSDEGTLQQSMNYLFVRVRI
ncbi:hypothetical protein Prudu_001360 [Prunus dulcis]|uniref:Uncharacterized protein n=1 Tax=Prunus dulcis TaxID=3755 RepID=A0A4Y1QND0_PRUDU|nr:hypothetical protein Prudu_001360 [Prunus dulcis]